MDLISTFIFWFVLIIVLSIVGSLAWNSYINRLKDKENQKRIEREAEAEEEERRKRSKQPQITFFDPFYSKVVGTSQLNENGVPIQTILPGIRPGAVAYLQRDRHNEYDINAVKVYAENTHIGYLKRTAAATVAPYLDQGRTVRVNIEEITGGDNGRSFGVNIKLFM